MDEEDGKERTRMMMIPRRPSEKVGDTRPSVRRQTMSAQELSSVLDCLREALQPPQGCDCWNKMGEKKHEEERLFNEEEISEFREAFLLFDLNGDGAINTEELGSLLRALGRNPDPQEIKEMMEVTRVLLLTE